MAENRTRTLNQQETIYGTLFWITLRNASMTIGDWKVCKDVIGNQQGANMLELQHHHKLSPTINGTLYNTNGTINREFTHYPIACNTVAIPDPRTKYGLADTYWRSLRAWEILAATNPSSPHVNVGQFVAEMKDIPSLVQGWGRSLLRSAAKGYISWRWAIKPMISDVEKMCNFVDAANKRFQQLRNLRDKRYWKRRCHLMSDRIATTPSRVQIHSEGAYLYATRQYIYTKRLWGSVNYKVASGSPIVDMTDDELMKFTRRTMLGLNSYSALEAAWELVPWSWFADWFSNTGTMVQALNNAVGLTWSRICLMMETSTEVTHTTRPGDIPDWITLTGDFDWKLTRKDRMAPIFPVTPFPTPYIPILDGGKLSILAALAALRR